MNEYITYLEEVFENFGEVTARKMFGGYGLFHKGLMFALVADDMLYLKADDENAAPFKQRNLGPFVYNKNGNLVQMSYFLAPDEVMEDREAAACWAKRSYDAARRAKNPKKRK